MNERQKDIITIFRQISASWITLLILFTYWMRTAVESTSSASCSSLRSFSMFPRLFMAWTYFGCSLYKCNKYCLLTEYIDRLLAEHLCLSLSISNISTFSRLKCWMLQRPCLLAADKIHFSARTSQLPCSTWLQHSGCLGQRGFCQHYNEPAEGRRRARKGHQFYCSDTVVFRIILFIY